MKRASPATKLSHLGQASKWPAGSEQSASNRIWKAAALQKQCKACGRNCRRGPVANLFGLCTSLELSPLIAAKDE